MRHVVRRSKIKDAIDADFWSRVRKSDVLVVGDNFGNTDVAERLPQELRRAGVFAVIAKSYGRTFYRSAFNAGLLPIECNADFIDDGDEIDIDIDNGRVQNLSKGLLLDIKPVPPLLKKLLDHGGILQYFKKNGGFDFEQI